MIFLPKRRLVGSCILQRTSTDTSTDASIDISIVTRSTLDRHATNMSIDCRPRVDLCFGRASTDVGRGIDRDHIGSLSVNYRRDIGLLSAECRSCIIRQSSESLPIQSADLSTDTIGDINRYYRPILDTIDRCIDQCIGRYIDRYQSIYRPVVCRPMYQPIYRAISTNTLGEGKVSVKHRCSIGGVSVKYR